MRSTATGSLRHALRRLPGHPSRWPRRVRLTRDGKFVIVLTFGIGFAAINTGHNLLYLMLSVLLATMIASGLLSEAVLRGVAVRRAGPRRFVAGHRALTAYEVRNTKRRIPSVALELWEVWTGPAPVRCDRALVLTLPAGAQATATGRITFERRGVYHTEGIVAGTGFPFSMFLKTRVFAAPSVAIVHPAPLDDSSVEDLLPVANGLRGAPAPHPGRQGDFYGVRDVRPGDSARAVHWKLTARRRRPVCVEFEHPRQEVAVLAVDLRAPARGAEEAVELAIRRAADAARSLSARGWSVGLLSAHAALPPRPGPGQLERILDALAAAPVLAPTEGASLDALRARARRMGGGRAHVVPIAATAGAAPQEVRAVV